MKELLSTVDPVFQADICWNLKKRLMVDFCLKYNFKRLVVGTSGHGIACKMLS